MPIQSAYTLNSNEIFASLANFIISQEVFADNIGSHQTLVDKARVDGGLFGDKKLYYATDALCTYDWANDAEAGNLLALDRPADPMVQDITIDQFRQIRLTVDNYLSKRAWGTEGAFSAFQSVMLSWMRETKKIYDGTLYNVFVGTTASTKATENRTISLVAGKEGQSIAQGLADLLVEMGDYSRDFNDYGFLRSYASGDVKVIWNSKFVNEIRKVDLPTIFHADGLVDKLDEDTMPARYFGYVNTSAGTAPAGNTAVRSLVEKKYGDVHVFPGDLIPAGKAFLANETYTQDANVICKVLVKLPPYMSAFEVGTSFFNARSLTENHYLTFGHNTLAYLKNYPYITVKKA